MVWDSFIGNGVGGRPAPRVDILIVDDRPENLLALRAVLEAPDINIVSALSGNEALAQTLEHNFACILLDVDMPGLSGLEVAQILHEDPLLHSVPIIFLSAFRSDEADVFTGYQYGAVDYLVKPLNPVIVRSKVRVFTELFRQQLLIRDLNVQLEGAFGELRQVTKVAAHDLKEPVRNIVHYCQQLERAAEVMTAPNVQKFALAALERSKKVCALLDDFVAFMNLRHTSQNEAQIDMKQLAREVVGEFAPGIAEIRANVMVGDLPSVRGHRAQLRLVLSALLDNALKFRAEKPVQVRITGQATEDELTFSIQDNCLGIEPEFRERIFELFQRLDANGKQTGSGTGLAVCRKIIEGHGGRIWVHSIPGVGSSFCFSVPRRGGPVDLPAVPRDLAFTSSENERIP